MIQSVNRLIQAVFCFLHTKNLRIFVSFILFRELFKDIQRAILLAGVQMRVGVEGHFYVRTAEPALAS